SVLSPQSSALTILGLGAYSAVSLGASRLVRQATQPSDRIPPVDGLRECPPGGNGKADWPFVSIIVPARNEERNLPRLLPTLLGQRYPNFEVIVVDDQSDDATPTILAEWA